MSAFLDFSAQPHWDPQTLAGAVPVRLRLHQLFAFDAARDAPLQDSANREPGPRRAWRQHEYLRVADLPLRFRVR
jgi:hypothetical protein